MMRDLIGTGELIRGFCPEPFLPIRSAFERNFLTLGETGAAVAIYHKGKCVVHLCGGYADIENRLVWNNQTLVTTYSAGKPMVALSILKLFDSGLVNLDEPVASYWPAFARTGKEEVTLRMTLNHLAGVPYLETALGTEDFYDWDKLISLHEDQRPIWKPGTVCAEHALFYGHILGEIVRRVDGRSIGKFFADEIARPTNSEFVFGVPQDSLANCANISQFSPAMKQGLGKTPLMHNVLLSPPGLFDADVINSASWRTNSIPAVNGHATADGLARLYAFLSGDGSIDGNRLLSEHAVNLIKQPKEAMFEQVFGAPVRYSFGFQQSGSDFGMAGVGGSLAFGNSKHQASFAYLTRHMDDHSRAGNIAKSLVECLENST